MNYIKIIKYYAQPLEIIDCPIQRIVFGTQRLI